MARIDYQLEYPLGSVSPKQLWLMLTTASGLSAWLDAEVSISEGIATLQWGADSDDTAHMYIDTAEQSVRFDWCDEEGGFELRLSSSELTKEITLLIADSCEEEDYDSSCQIWQQQVQALHRALGLPS